MRKGFGKIVSLMLVLTMALTVFASFSAMNVSAAEQKFKQYETKAGNLIIEAEDIILDKQFAYKESNKKASGKAVLVTINPNVADPPLTEPGHFGFQVKLDRAAAFVIWARICTGSGGDSVFLDNGAGNGTTGIYRAMWLPAIEDTYEWVQLQAIAGAEGDVITVRFRTREQELRIDSILLTAVSGYEPKGKTPELIDPDVLIVEDFPKTDAPMPTVTPAPDHPRIFIRPSEIEAMREKMKHPYMQYAVDEFNKLKDREFNGELEITDVANYSGIGLATIEAKAFDYLINGNKENGLNAIEAIKNYIRTCTYIGYHDATRNQGHVMFTAAEVYDWCHDLLTDEDKEFIVASCQNLGKQMEVGFPPRMSLAGHGGELQQYRDYFSFAIAVYDEYPEWYNHIGGLLPLQVKTKNFLYQSGTHDQGHNYGLGTRYRCEGWAQQLFYHMNDEKGKLFTDDMAMVPYEGIYKLRPDGQIFAWGDDWNQYGHTTNARIDTVYSPAYFFGANFYKDPVLKGEWLFTTNGGTGFNNDPFSSTCVQQLLFVDPDVEVEYRDSLPLTRYFPYPNGMMIARTGWNMGMKSPDTVAVMRIGALATGGHGHQTAGSFQIYHKGILAMKSGSLNATGTINGGHTTEYYRDSIAHNCMLIGSADNPSGCQIEVNYDGNSMMYGTDTLDYSKRVESGRFDQGDILGYEFGPDTQYPEYTYLSGDIAGAYDTKNVQEAIRSMMFMPLDEGAEEGSAALFVFDKVKTKSTKYKKTFTLHMEEEPKLEGNVLTVTRTQNGYNGKLINQTLLPAEAKFELIGGPGKQFWLDGRNIDSGVVDPKGTWAEIGWGRLEVSPKKVSGTDYFLNVMYTLDADSEMALAPAELIETETFAGAKIFNKVAMFGKERDRVSKPVEFVIPGSESELDISVTGLEEGTWEIKVDGKTVGTEVASVDGGMVYFKAPAGTCTLEHVSDDAEKTFTTSPAPEVEGITIIVNDNFLYSDVAPTIIDGRTLIPMRAIAEEIGATVSYDEATATATVLQGYTEIKLTENSKTAYVNGSPKELDVPAMVIDGRFMIPVRFVSETLGASVNWYERAQIVKVSKTILDKEQSWNFENGIKVLGIQSSGYTGSTTPDLTLDGGKDGSYGGYWADAGDKEGGAWITYDFGTTFNIETMKIAFHVGDKRNYSFTVEVSEDGENFEYVIENGLSGGQTIDFEDFDLGGVKARYVRYTCTGSNENNMSSTREVAFIGKIAR